MPQPPMRGLGPRGFLTQETYLFNGTIRENLLYAKDYWDMVEEEVNGF